LKARGHFNSVCIDVPNGSHVDFRSHAVSIPGKPPSVVTCSITALNGADRHLEHMHQLIGATATSACFTAESGADAEYSRVVVSSAEEFVSSRLWWLDTDKL
jgi:hypothetical protein